MAASGYYAKKYSSPPRKYVSEDLQQRLKSFVYHFDRIVEINFNFYLGILNECVRRKLKTPEWVRVLEKILERTTQYGDIILNLFMLGEIYKARKIDNDTAKALSSLLYYYESNRDLVREKLIKSGIEIFYCFEKQFMNVTRPGGPQKAMYCLGVDAAYRYINYALKKNKTTCNIGTITNGVIKGKSHKKTVIYNNRTVPTTNIYESCGLLLEGQFYKTQISKSEYGYRRGARSEKENNCYPNLFSINVPVNAWHEHYEILRLEDYMRFFADIREFIMSQTPEDRAMLDREQKHTEICNRLDRMDNTLLQIQNDCRQLARKEIDKDSGRYSEPAKVHSQYYGNSTRNKFSYYLNDSDDSDDSYTSYDSDESYDSNHRHDKMFAGFCRKCSYF